MPSTNARIELYLLINQQVKASLIVFLLIIFSFSLFAQEKNKIEIGILLEQENSETNQIIERMKEEVKAVVGEDAEISFPAKWSLSNGDTKAKAQANLQLLYEGSADIILAFGPINSVVISQQKEHLKPTLLFGAVPEDFIGIERKRTTSGIHNLVYLISSHSIQEDLASFKKIYDYKKVGIALNKTLTDNLEVKEFLEGLFANNTDEYVLIPFQYTADIISGLDEVDALYIGGGYLFNADELGLLTGELNLRKIPSMTASAQRDVQMGLLATNRSESNIDQMIRRIALSVEAIVNGTDPADLPLYFENQEKLTLNFNTAEILGIPIRYSQIATTNLVGDLDKIYSEKKYDLKILMEEIILSNLSIQSSQKSVELAEQELRLAKSNYLPDVQGSATGTYIDPNLAKVSNGQNPEFSTAANVNVSQVVYSPGLATNIKINQELLAAEKENLNIEKLNSVFNASNLYFNTLLLKANLKISKNNRDLTEQNLLIAQQKYESGQSGKSDVLRFQSQLAQNTQEFVDGYNQLTQAFFSLNQILNQPISRKIDVKDALLGDSIYGEYNYEQIKEILDDPALLEPFIEFLVLEGKKNSPELKSLDYTLKANKQNIWLNTQGRYLPTIAFQGQVNNTFSRNGAGSEFPQGFPSIPNRYYSMGLNLSIPIFQQNQRNINRQSAIVQREQLIINQDNTQLSIEQNISSAVLQIISQISNLELSKVFVLTAKESLALTQEAYKQGGVTWVQLIDAQNNYFQAELSNATAVYNFLNSAIQLERNMGFFFILNSKEENEAFRQRFSRYLQTRQ